MLRLGVGFALVGLAILRGFTWSHLFLAGAGTLIMFTAVYDRCPVYRLLSGRLKEVLHRHPAGPSSN
jgi:Inner membrane protein YgaP-like, transmembrane domain